MYVQKRYKAALIEQVTGIRSDTLRSWRRKSFLVGLGFPPDGTTSWYSFADAVALTVGQDLIHRGRVETPAALMLATFSSSDIETMLARSSGQNDWQLLLVGYDIGLTMMSLEPVTYDDVKDLTAIISQKPVSIVVNVGWIARKVAAAFVANGHPQFGGAD